LIALPTRRTRTTTTGQAADLARVAARAADDKKGTDVVVLEVGDVLAITDFFVIASAPNTRQVKTIAEEVEARVKAELGRSPVRSEGLSDLRWVLLDYGDVCVHVFFEETRQFYDLERLWSDVPRLEWAASRVAASEG